MSTRGCVAIGTPDAWRGVYNHYDSYPTGIGCAVWHHIQELIKGGSILELFALDLLSYDDWRAYLGKGICEYCGRRTSQPHSISGVIFMRECREKEFGTQDDMRRYFQSLPAWKGRDNEIEAMVKTEWQIRDNIARTGYPDPKGKYHEHDTRPAREQHITAENSDPLFIEWVYVVDPKTGTFHVLTHNGCSKPNGRLPKGVWSKPAGNGRCDYGHCIYWHERVGSYLLDGPEPDWEALERAAVPSNPSLQTPEDAHGDSDNKETRRET